MAAKKPKKTSEPKKTPERALGALDLKAIALAKEYIKDRNFSQAMIRLGYAESTSRTAGTRDGLRRNPYFISTLRRLEEERAANIPISPDEVIKFAADALKLDPRLLFDEQGKMLMPHEWPDHVSRYVNGITIKGNGDLLVKLMDRNPVLDKLMRHFGMFKEDNAQKADPIAELMAYIGKSPGGDLPAERSNRGIDTSAVTVDEGEED